MKLYVKEKLLSLHSRYYIYNEFEQVEYEIESRILTVGDKTTIYDKNRHIVAYIEQDWFRMLPFYNVYINEQLQYSIKKKFQLFKNDYELSNNYKVEGTFFSYNFVIKNDKDEIIATVNREFLTIGDKYQIDVLKEEDITTVLTIVVAITNDIDRAQASASN